MTEQEKRDEELYREAFNAIDKIVSDYNKKQKGRFKITVIVKSEKQH